MTVVIDASVLVAAVVDSGADGHWARSMIGVNTLIAPELLLAESTNVLRRKEIEGAIGPGVAEVARRDVLRRDIELLPFAPFANRVWKLRGNLTSYDAWYVAIAEAFDLPLVTLDVRLGRAPGPACRFSLPPNRVQW